MERAGDDHVYADPTDGGWLGAGLSAGSMVVVTAGWVIATPFTLRHGAARRPAIVGPLQQLFEHVDPKPGQYARRTAVARLPSRYFSAVKAAYIKMYALATVWRAVGALASGRLYDRVGLRGLFVVPLLTAVVPFLSFSTDAGVASLGAAVSGFGLGIHESTLRAAVADLVAGRRGTAYGAFTSRYGVAWLVGGTVIGATYAHSVGSARAVVVGTASAERPGRRNAGQRRPCRRDGQ